MTTRNLTTGLIAIAAMLFATSSLAGDFSLEASGMVSDRGAETSASGTDRDCTSPSPTVADSGNVAPGRSDASPPIAARDPALSNGDAVQAVGGTATGGGSTAPEGIGAPLKARSSRWQSLVPGAIK
jgi:hypothetical protein